MGLILKYNTSETVVFYRFAMHPEGKKNIFMILEAKNIYLASF